jgi:catechol 2,3-dioxygenase-like lactoylglutathione lyase family enzyme
MKCIGALMTIATLDCDRLANFYQHLLGQAPVSHIPNVYAEFHLPGVKLGIFRPKTIEPSTSAPPLLCSPTPPPSALCLEVENLEAAIAHLTDLGYPPSGEILIASHGREIYAHDPDGNCLILHQG